MCAQKSTSSTPLRDVAKGRQRAGSPPAFHLGEKGGRSKTWAFPFAFCFLLKLELSDFNIDTLQSDFLNFRILC